MNFFKTSFWASFATGVTMICGLITTKYIAVMIGPEGMAFVGQFNNTTLILSLLATGSCLSGVVKYIAENSDVEWREKVISSALLIVLTCTLCISTITVIFASYFSKQAFDDTSYTNVFYLFAIFILFPALNGLISSILNGLQRIKRMALVSCISAVLNVLAIIGGAHFFGVKGVLLAQSASSFISFFFYVYLLKKSTKISLVKLWGRPDYKFIWMLLGFSTMSLVSSLVTPAFQLLIRSKLLHNFNPETAGLWQANTRLSDYYLSFISTVLGIYYLPKLSSLKETHEIKKEVRLGFARIIPLVVAFTGIIWILRNYIIKYLLSEEFEGMMVFLKWQLIGDIIKIASWLLAYLLIAKAMKKSYIIIELVFATSYVLLSFFMIETYGMVGSVYAFCLNYTLYFLTLFFLLRKYII